MHMDSYDHGVPSWVDLATPDIEATSAFYSGLFGWECPPGAEEFGGYRVCTLDGRTVAGIMTKMDPNMPSFWTSYVNVDSTDEVAAKVAAAGGATLAPAMDVGEGDAKQGRMAVFADTIGAVFGVWEPAGHPGAGVVNEPGALCWNELMSTDLLASEAFYSEVFGWGLNTVPPEGPVQYGEWQVGGRSVAGLMPKPPMLPAEVPPNWGVYFAVADTDAAVEKATGLGGSVLNPAMDIEPGRFAVLADNVGAPFMVIAMKGDLG